MTATQRELPLRPGPLAPARAFVESARFQNFIILVILVNAVTLALETAPATVGPFLEVLSIVDQVCLGIFVAELLTKLAVYRLDFFKSGWNWFDFIIVGISLVPAAESLSALRALRILRVLRIVSIIPSLRRVVEAGIRALPGMGSVLLVMAMLFVIGAVVATKLYGPTFPQYFGTMGESLFSLFTVMTLEGWPDLAREVMEVHPNAWAFFIPFLVITALMVLNLLLGVIVNAMEETAQEEEAKLEEVERELNAALLAEIRQLRADLAVTRDGKPV
ncbi:MAG: ion transporter [Micropepsaceae bacterium]